MSVKAPVKCLICGAHAGHPCQGPPEGRRCPFAQAWQCECGETDLAKRYGGPADHNNEPDAPCEACVMASFAEHG